MLRAVRLKFLFLFILTVVAIMFVLPSLTGELPGWWEKHVSRGLKLGLDLKGGMHLILQVDMESAVSNALNRDANDLKEMAEKRGLALKIGDVAKDVLPVTLANKDEQAAFQKFLKEEFPHLAAGEPQRQDGGLVFTLSLTPEEIKQLQETHPVPEPGGSAQPHRPVRRDRAGPGASGADQIVVQLPGVQDPQRALDLIGQTAQLEFKLVDDQAQINLPELIEAALKSGKLKAGYTREQLTRLCPTRFPPRMRCISKRASTGRPAGWNPSPYCSKRRS